jgi:hypothetical protein
MSDTADRATLTAKLEQAQQRIAELEYSVRLLRGADETAESLAADLTRATQRVAELESRRCQNCAAWSTISHPEFGDERWCAHNGLYTSPDYTCGDFKRKTNGT